MHLRELLFDETVDHVLERVQINSLVILTLKVVLGWQQQDSYYGFQAKHHV